MNFTSLIAQIQSQLEKLADREETNQKQQQVTNQRIKNLENKIKRQYHRQSELDDEAIKLYRQGEELKSKLKKIERIKVLAQEIDDLQEKCPENLEIIENLYSYISLLAQEEGLSVDRQTILKGKKQSFPNYASKQKSRNKNRQATKKNNQDRPVNLTLQNIKTVLPNAESIYKQLIAHNLEKYQTYQNIIIDDLDVIWCSVAFIAFGRSAYRQLSFKHHPDLNGSAEAMQFINAAWEISEEYLANRVNT